MTYAVLGGVVVTIAIVTGSGVVRAFIAGIAAFVLATGWTWWRLRSRRRDWERQVR